MFKISKNFLFGSISLIIGVLTLVLGIMGTLVLIFSLVPLPSETSMGVILLVFFYAITSAYLGHFVYQKTKTTKTTYYFNSVVLISLGVIVLIWETICTIYSSPIVTFSTTEIISSTLFTVVYSASYIINSIFLLKNAKIPSIGTIRKWAGYLLLISVISFVIMFLLIIIDVAITPKYLLMANLGRPYTPHSKLLGVGVYSFSAIFTCSFIISVLTLLGSLVYPVYKSILRRKK